MSGRVTRVKICGITNPEDAAVAIEAGADALGFNAWPRSKRFVDLKAQSAWIAELPPYVTRVAVVVSPNEAEAGAIAALPFIDAIQFHGDEAPAFCRRFARSKRAFFKAVGVENEQSLADPGRFGTANLLLDAHAPGTYGGTGSVIDWDLAARFVRAHPDLRVVLSGGLSPGNVVDAVRIVRPYGVDVASGVESAPGRKDPGAVRDFVAAVRAAG